MSDNLNQKIYVAGHRGMVGSAIVRNLADKGYKNIVTRTHVELDLTDQKSVKFFFEQEKPDQVYLAALKWAVFMRIILFLQSLFIKT
jgi:GDP-L-fucose synthase